jgi:hypothetical protein
MNERLYDMTSNVMLLDVGVSRQKYILKKTYNKDHLLRSSDNNMTKWGCEQVLNKKECGSFNTLLINIRIKAMTDLIIAGDCLDVSLSSTCYVFRI